MDKRFFKFLLLSFAIIAGWQVLMFTIYGARRPNDQKVAEQQDQPGKDDNAPGKEPADKAGDQAAGAAGDQELDARQNAAAAEPAKPAKPENGGDQPAVQLAPAKANPAAWRTLGSLDPASPYRFLATLTSQGGAIERIELNGPRFFTELEHFGYLGRLDLAPAPNGRSALVRVVGPGTPAATVLRAGDVLLSIDDRPIADEADFDEVLRGTRPGDKVLLAVERGGQALAPIELTLARQPVEVVRPEDLDPTSFLMTFEEIDGLNLSDIQRRQARAKADDEDVGGPAVGLPEDEELPGIRLRTMHWEVMPGGADEVVFRAQLASPPLAIVKRYRLEPLPADAGVGDGYHLVLVVEVQNLDVAKHTVAYRLDGPTGLPTEGWWYQSKIGHSFSGRAGPRDVAVKFQDGSEAAHITASAIVAGEATPWLLPIEYLAVDSQYFFSALLPQSTEEAPPWLDSATALRVGPFWDQAHDKDKSYRRLTNVSFRVIGKTIELAAGKSRKQAFKIFAGPMQPEILAEHGLDELVYYGWYSWISIPLRGVLHGFYSIVHNYGLAIVMLTMLVRSIMFPIGRWQALNAQRMQDLAPEIKNLKEKYKNQQDQLTRAVFDLYKKNKVRPVAGCLPVFLQIPIFVGLHHLLAVDVELRHASLFGDGVDWCSNLAAPDMLFRWDGWMPGILTRELGMFSLGPYFNLLPLFTVGLFLVQQKMFMPPPTDEQQEMQQKIMKYMMVVMAFMFFTVASGLCLYFIVSNLWSIGERKLLPKSKSKLAGGEGAKASLPAPRPPDGGADRKKRRARR